MNININQIEIGENRRPANPEKVKELSESIKEIGLLNPITITEKNKLIAGAHRIEAFKLLNREEIPCNILGLQGLQAELAEIDENLIRNEVDFLDRGELFERRKEIYEELYPETKREATLKQYRSAESAERQKPAFTEDISKKTGISTRVIHEEIQIAKNLIPEVKAYIRKEEPIQEALNKTITDRKEIYNEYGKNQYEEKKEIPVRPIVFREINKTEALKLARKSPEEQKTIINKFKTGEATTVNNAILAINREKSKEIPDLPEDKFSVIYADPPWQYEHVKNSNDAIENKYGTMDLEDIKKLKIPAADNSVLYLWATAPKLEEAIQVLNSWGFSYRTCMVWDKEWIGMGYWFRSQHELLLVGVKGKFSPPKEDARFPSVLREKRKEHSKKPEIIYERIEKMYPGFKYIELFARNTRKEWLSWGNEI